MKFVNRSLSLFVFIAAIVGTMDTAHSRCNKTLTNGWGDEWEPFILGTPDKASGLDMEILEAVVVGAGCKLKHTKHPLPWKRHLKMLENGEVDIATGASFTKERAKYAHFSKPYRSEYLAIYIRKGEASKFPFKVIEDLTKIKFLIGALMGSTYGPKTDAVLKLMGENVQRVTDSDLDRKKLINKRIDGYLSYLPDEPMTLAKLKLNDKIEQHPMPPISTGDIHFMFSKKTVDKQTIDAIHASLKKIKADGTYDKIIKRYTEKYGVSKW